MNLGSHTHFYIGSCMGVGVDVLSLKDELSKSPGKIPKAEASKAGAGQGRRAEEVSVDVS